MLDFHRLSLTFTELFTMIASLSGLTFQKFLAEEKDEESLKVLRLTTLLFGKFCSTECDQLVNKLNTCGEILLEFSCVEVVEGTSQVLLMCV